MPLEPTKRAGAFASALLAVVLAGCGADQTTEPTFASAATATPGVAACTPGADHATEGVGLVPDPVLAARCAAKPGDLIDIVLDELHPTQPSLGYDEVYYKLGRYRSNKDELAGNFNKRFDDWCEANGQESAGSWPRGTMARRRTRGSSGSSASPIVIPSRASSLLRLTTS